MLQGTRFEDAAVRWPPGRVAPHASYLVAEASRVTRLDPDVDLAGASLFRMAGVARHGVRLAGIREGDLVVVIGQGMIGQMSAQAARRRGGRVITSERIPLRVEASSRYSADLALNAETDDLDQAVREESPDGADVVIDTTGNSEMFSSCLALVRPEGRISLQGYYPEPIRIDFHPTHLKRPTISVPCGWDEDDDARIATDLADGRLTIAPLITHQFGYEQAAEAYKLVMEQPDQTLGLVFRWSDT
jgi:2-desacetyl-2-hydroxyethyl bacteriochlorophyllide A dehydrogenase